jgi:hypothetical protein
MTNLTCWKANVALALVSCALVPNAHAADWTKLRSYDDGATTYVDVDAVRRSGDRGRVWSLEDYKSPKAFDQYTYLSTKFLQEVDCANERIAVVYFVNMTQHMGLGEFAGAFQTAEPTSWRIVAPRSVDAFFLKLACGTYKR